MWALVYLVTQNYGMHIVWGSEIDPFDVYKRGQFCFLILYNLVCPFILALLSKFSIFKSGKSVTSLRCSGTNTG